MKINLSNHGDTIEMPTNSTSATPQMVRSRTVEIAVRAGRSPIEIRQSDYEQAKRELTGETDLDRQHALLYPGWLLVRF